MFRKILSASILFLLVRPPCPRRSLSHVVSLWLKIFHCFEILYILFHVWACREEFLFLVEFCALTPNLLSDLSIDLTVFLFERNDLICYIVVLKYSPDSFTAEKKLRFENGLLDWRSWCLHKKPASLLNEIILFNMYKIFKNLLHYCTCNRKRFFETCHQSISACLYISLQ